MSHLLVLDKLPQEPAECLNEVERVPEAHSEHFTLTLKVFIITVFVSRSSDTDTRFIAITCGTSR